MASLTCAFVVTSLLFWTSRASTCVWTDKHCSCTNRAAVVGQERCWDLIKPLHSTKDTYACKSRPCRGGYVCDCDGTSYCEFVTSSKRVLVHKHGHTCKYEYKNVTSVRLVEKDIKNVINHKPKADECVFTDDQCTCAWGSAVGSHHDCVDFLKTDPKLGAVCKLRDCRESRVCDCGGDALCNKRTNIKQAWRSTGSLPGQPGHVMCKRTTVETSIVTEVGKKDELDGA